MELASEVFDGKARFTATDQLRGSAWDTSRAREHQCGLVDAVHAVAASYRTPDQNPAWLVSYGGLKALRKTLEATTNAPLLTDLGQDQPRLLGIPSW